MRTGTMPASPWGSSVIATTAKPAPQILSFDVTRSVTWLSPGGSSGYKAATGTLAYANSGNVISKVGSPWHMPFLPRVASEVYPPDAGESLNLDVAIVPQGNAAPYTTRVLTGAVEGNAASVTGNTSVSLVDLWDSMARDVALEPTVNNNIALGAVAEIARQLGFDSLPPPVPGVLINEPLQGGLIGLQASPYATVNQPPNQDGLYYQDAFGPFRYDLIQHSYTLNPGGSWGAWTIRPAFGFTFYATVLKDSNTTDPVITVTTAQGANWLKVEWFQDHITVSTPTTSQTVTGLTVSGTDPKRWTVTAWAYSSTQTQVRVWTEGNTTPWADVLVGADVPTSKPTVGNTWTITPDTFDRRVRGFQFFSPPSASAVPDSVTKVFTPKIKWLINDPGYGLGGIAHVLKARPAITGKGNELLSWIAQRVGAGLYLNEDGVLVWADWAYLKTERTPVLTLTTDMNISDLQWQAEITERPRKIIVTSKPAAVQKKPFAWVGEDAVVPKGTTMEVFVKPPDKTTWVNLWTNIKQSDQEWTSSFLNWVYVSGADPTNSTLQYSLTQVAPGEQTWKWTVTNPDTNSGDVYLRFRSGWYAGAPGPIVYADAAITWGEAKQEGNPIGPELARDYTHEADWTLCDNDVTALREELERQCTAAMPRLSNITLFPDVRLQLCDFIAVQCRIPTDPSATATIKGYVDGIHLSSSGGALTQTISMRLTSITSNTTYDMYQYDVANTYNAEQTAAGTQTYTAYQGGI